MHFMKNGLSKLAAKFNGRRGATILLQNIETSWDKEALRTWIHELGFAGVYEWFYLPLSILTRQNSGRAFIHFATRKSGHIFIQDAIKRRAASGCDLAASVSPTQGLRLTKRASLEQQITEWAMESCCPGEVTLHVANLDVRCTKHELAQIIDNSGFAGAYDFLSLPGGGTLGHSAGYAIINFTSQEAARAFVQAMHGKVLHSGHSLSVKMSPTQGLRDCLAQWLSDVSSRRALDVPYVLSMKKSGDVAARATCQPPSDKETHCWLSEVTTAAELSLDGTNSMPDKKSAACPSQRLPSCDGADMPDEGSAICPSQISAICPIQGTVTDGHGQTGVRCIWAFQAEVSSSRLTV